MSNSHYTRLDDLDHEINSLTRASGQLLVPRPANLARTVRTGSPYYASAGTQIHPFCLGQRIVAPRLRRQMILAVCFANITIFNISIRESLVKQHG